MSPRRSRRSPTPPPMAFTAACSRRTRTPRRSPGGRARTPRTPSCSGSPPTPACASASCSHCAGKTSTSTLAGLSSTAPSPPASRVPPRAGRPASSPSRTPPPRPSPACRPAATTQPRGLRLLLAPRPAPRRLSRPSPLQGSPRRRRPAAPALPRPAPRRRQPRRPPRRRALRPGLPRPLPDHDHGALHARQGATRGRRPSQPRVRPARRHQVAFSLS